MTRLGSLSYWSRQWRIYFFYFSAVFAVGLMSAYAGTRLTKKLVSAAAESAGTFERPLSRVERQLRDRARQAVRVPPAPTDEVVALQRPALHPATMAAQLDRVEAAGAFEVQTTSTDQRITVAACDPPNCVKTQVRGWRHAPHLKPQAKIRTAAAPNAVAPNRAKLPKGIKFSKAKAVAAIALPASSFNAATTAKGAVVAGKMSLLPKGAAVVQEPDTSAPFTFKQPVRIAKTPGEIVRVSLLGS